MKRPKFSEEQIVYALRQPDPWHPLRGYLSAARQRRANLLGVENEVRPLGRERTPAVAPTGGREQPIETAGRGPLSGQAHKVLTTTMGKRGLLRNPGLVICRGCSIVCCLVFLSLAGCGADGEQGPAPLAGPTVNLIWDPVNDPNLKGYSIHYGKQSPNQPGSCAYSHLTTVSSPEGTVTNLDPGSTYYFAVSAYNGAQSACSNEVHAQT